MAQFRVGQRVKVIDGVFHLDASRVRVVGSSGEVVTFELDGDLPYVVCVDNLTSNYPDGNFRFLAEHLAPLVPPDAWASEKVKQVTKPQHMEPAAPVPVWP